MRCCAHANDHTRMTARLLLTAGLLLTARLLFLTVVQSATVIHHRLRPPINYDRHGLADMRRVRLPVAADICAGAFHAAICTKPGAGHNVINASASNVAHATTLATTSNQWDRNYDRVIGPIACVGDVHIIVLFIYHL